MGCHNLFRTTHFISIIILAYLTSNLGVAECQDLVRTRVLRNTTLFLSQSPCSDMDNDTICDDVDNCPNIFNPFQSDIDNDGIGDVCDINPTIFNFPTNFCGVTNCTVDSECDDGNPCTTDLCINGTCINMLDLSLNASCEASIFSIYII